MISQVSNLGLIHWPLAHQSVFPVKGQPTRLKHSWSNGTQDPSSHNLNPDWQFTESQQSLELLVQLPSKHLIGL